MEGISLAMLSDAGAWLARLNSPLRDQAAEDGFQRWLGDDSRHATAFRLLTEDWEQAGELKRFAHIAIGAGELARPPHYGTETPRRYREFEEEARRRAASRSAIRAWRAIAATVLVVAAAGLYLYLDYFSGVRTGVGEQRTLALEDGSRIILNTDTRILERYTARERRIELKSGEAFFDVAPQSTRPFIVAAGGRIITALGTSFVVRGDERELAVTLVEGKIAVSAGSADPGSVLKPGERVTFARAMREPRIDTPQIDKITAWQQGKVAIDNMSLADAVAEMNRYSKVRIEIKEPQTAALPLSGVFAAGQSEAFARAVAESHGLEVTERGDTIVLSRR